MTFAEFFARYWWLIFPVFGMVMAFYGAIASERRSRSTIDLIKSYVDQGKEPPPELLQLAAKRNEAIDDWDMGMGSGSSSSGLSSRIWTLFTFVALAAGFGVGYWWVRAEDYAFAFLIVAVTMSVLALGALVVLIFARK